MQPTSLKILKPVLSFYQNFFLLHLVFVFFFAFLDLWDTIIRPNLGIIDTEEAKDVETISNKIIEENIPNLGKQMDIQVGRAFTCQANKINKELPHVIV
jgi:hypothetical protein